eukprot:Gregarina_sp_Poly_1__9588@NODE_605_length_7202_cov_256_472039_g465_i0_p6_GENE_NODE_605_length_7202_cov_256_472039_g465_i0NODE_605_length_7202_cov_256_472039_g465_i0_p6_ORF_typecomplete_len117_score17_55NTF2/PF02136_20/7_8e15Mtr2/PF10429_9/0_029_NODE_605_length_7202_cov_256_472039_g465_i077427
MSVTPQAIATQFLESYYANFRSNRALLQNFYNENSVLKWEREEYKGPAQIGECFQKMSAGQLDFPSIDSEVQVAAGNGLLILVTGEPSKRNFESSPRQDMSLLTEDLLLALVRFLC